MPAPYKKPPVRATPRGPTRFSHRPPKNDANPSTMMAIVKVSVTSEMVQLNCLARGTRKTLQAYTAPRAIWSRIPANAIHQRSSLFITSPLLQRFDVGVAAEVSYFRIAISGSTTPVISHGKHPNSADSCHRVVSARDYPPQDGPMTP